MQQNELPPSDYLRRQVSFESRYGMYTPLMSFFPLATSLRAPMTYLSVNRLLLISILSF